MDLHSAVVKGKTKEVRRLLQGGFLRRPVARADVNEKGPDGMAPLYEATTRGNCKIVKLFLEHGADAKTELHRTARLGRTECCELLLQHGADVNARNDDGRTPLHTTTKGIAALLLAHGADPNAEDNDGRTPLRHSR
jgi:26S proteasome non-ATPase regulatory subunit 10